MTRRRYIQAVDHGKLPARISPKQNVTHCPHSKKVQEPTADETGIVDVEQCVYCGVVYNTPTIPTINEFH